MPDVAESPAQIAARLLRLARLTRKELRESLRDRRTIITLVMMPILLYPLLSVAFQQFFLSSASATTRPRAILGFRDREEGERIYLWLVRSGLHFAAESDPRRPIKAGEPSTPEFVIYPFADLAAAVARLDCDVGIQFKAATPPANPDDLAIDLELFVARGDPLSEQAARTITDGLAAAGRRELAIRLEQLGVTQRPAPIEVSRQEITPTRGTGGGRVSAASIIPFILILMTVTGAVYPAIDLTAGERERGTLEVLVAAPIPRLSVLIAKYVAVVSVALLTASVNLLAMLVTLWAGGLSGLLFGSGGLSPTSILLVFTLLVLFAAFFSAVLLVLTSFARSFKEAQAYLIPLMLASFAPGVISLTPGLQLSGPWLVAPLVNIVMLARDLLEGKGTAAAGAVVVASTALYAIVALTLASRVFGSETVLYSQSVGWRSVVQRPREPQLAASSTLGWGTLALLFPLLFVANGAVAQAAGLGLSTRLIVGACATAAVFGAVPALLACWYRLRFTTAFALGVPRPLLAFGPALLLGTCLWPFAHELVVFARDLGVISLSDEHLEQARALIERLKSLPLPLLIACLAVVPAVFEELFFRGFLFTSLGAWSGRAVILATGLSFGLFHVVVTDALALERLPPSCLMGVVLGWLRYRTGSIWPGIALHATHNGLLVTLAVRSDWLRGQGWGIEEAAHLPLSWLITAGFATTAAIWLVSRLTRTEPGEGTRWDVAAQSAGTE